MTTPVNDRATRVIAARAPTRIDFGGGWTDVPPYCDREGGFVCNVAITLYAVATVTTADRDGAADGTPGAALRDSREDADIAAADRPLVRAALRRSGISDARVRLKNDFPVGAGLGGSSAASAAVLGAVAAWRGQKWDCREIAEEGRRIEVQELGVAGGRQDHYAATHGGALALTFDSSVVVRRIPLAADTRENLVRRAILIYTGQSRISGDTITAVLGAYENREARVLAALRRMRELAQEMAVVFERGDLDSLGELIGEHWLHQRSLHPSIPTQRIDDIVERADRAGALGAKAMGASGGGCVLVLARDDNAERVRQAVADMGEILRFDVDEEGLALARGTGS